MTTQHAIYHRTFGAAELSNREARTIELDGKKIAVVRVEDRHYAVDALCSHMGVPLDQGSVDGHELVCPWHAARFCVKTGSKTSGPGWCDLETYPTRVTDGFIEVSLEKTIEPTPIPVTREAETVVA